MKKIITAVLSATLCLAVLTPVSGCQKPEEETCTQTQGKDSGDNVDPVEEEKEEDTVQTYDSVPLDFKDDDDISGNDPAGEADLGVFKDMGHPRVLMNRADFTSLKKKVTENSSDNRVLTKLHEVMLEVADAALTSRTSLTFTSNTSRNQDRAKEAMKRITSCAYAYRMTGTKKYLDKAVEDLETVVEFSDWNASSTFLTAAQMAAGVAIGYDWLYYSLDYNLRVKIRDRLLRYAIIPAFSADFRTAEHNWNQVCYGGTLLAAIAIYGKEKTQSGALINDCIENNGKVLRKIYEPDGIYPEGYSYWGFGTGFQTFIFVALERVFGTLYGMDDCAALKKTPQWLLMSSGVKGKVYSFGDSTGNWDQPKMGMWWFAMHYNDPSLLRTEWKLLSNTVSVSNPYSVENPYGPDMSEARMLAVAIACANRTDGLDSVIDATTASLPNMFYGLGEVPSALFRTEWSDRNTDRYLGVKGGKANHTHGHMDAGSFVYDALGCRWAQELNKPSYREIQEKLQAVGGNYWDLTQDSFRWRVWALNNRSHNTLTINDTDHRVDGKAIILNILESGRGVKLDLTPVFDGEAASVFRTLEIRDGKDLYVTDEIQALDTKAAEIQWRMVTGATVTAEADREKLTQSGKTLYLKVNIIEGSANPVFTSWPAQGGESWDEAYSGCVVAGYTATVPAGQSVTFQTVLTAEAE